MIPLTEVPYHPGIPTTECITTCPLPVFTAVAGQYSTTLVQQLIHLLGVYPIGSLVRLNTGEQAVVIWVHSHSRLTPTIKLLKNASGQPYQEQEIIDLSAQINDGASRSIQESIDPREAGWDMTKILDSLW